MPKFRLLLERVDTVTRQAVLVVDAASAQAAQERIIANLQTDEGFYDGRLVEVDGGFGRMTVKIRDGVADSAEIQQSSSGEFNGGKFAGNVTVLQPKREFSKRR
jgi:hypothetical protein